MRFNTKRGVLLLILTLLPVAACGGGDDEGAEANPIPDTPLMRPASLAEEAPAAFLARFETSKGVFVIQATRELAPIGVDRFYTMVKNGYYDGVRFYRVMDGFMAQFGMHGNPYVNAVWANASIMDDPVVASNTRGMVSFAMSTANSRTAQIFVNYRDNSNLDSMGFSPFGEVIEGMDVVDQLYSGYGDGAPLGDGPFQNTIARQGNEYLDADFPNLDRVISATIIDVEAATNDG